VERIEYVAQNVLFEKWRDRVGGVLAELAETNEEAGALLEELRSLKVESLSEFIEKLSGVVGEDLRLLSRIPRPTREDIETWIKAME
jgi:predicted CopG family antitoxin